MKLQTLFQACGKVASIRLRQHPDAKIKMDNDEYVRLDDLVTELKNLESWCYKGEFEVEKIIRCRNCKHYHRYKKRLEDNRYDHKIIVACSKDKQPREPEFFCAYGEERENR